MLKEQEKEQSLNVVNNFDCQIQRKKPASPTTQIKHWRTERKTDCGESVPGDRNKLGLPSFPSLLSPSLLGPSYCLPGPPSGLTAHTREKLPLRHASLLSIFLSNIYCNFSLNFKSTSPTLSCIDLW